jgi:hypothetical protein
VSYKLVEPTFDAIEWTGSNVTELVAFAAAAVPTSTWTPEVLDEASSGGDPAMIGAVFLESSPRVGTVVARLTERVTFGPKRGTSTAEAAFATVSAEDFAAQYVEI